MLPRAINYGAKIYETIGMIKMNNGAFLIAKNENELINVDFTRIPTLTSQYNLKNATLSENILIDYIKNYIQKNIAEGTFNNVVLNDVINNINIYINSHPQLLKVMQQLDANNQINQNNVSEVLKYFENIMNGNQYFVKKQEQSIENNQINSLPEYDEQSVTAILSMKQNEGFDINLFIQKYINNFNIEQIDLILQSYRLNEQQINLLKTKKQEKLESTESQTKSNVRNKTKRLSLPAFKTDKEAAFVDTLLLSFTVGIFCGIYLMYFVLTIMS